MTDKRASELTVATTVATTDRMVVLVNPGGTPSLQTITDANFITANAATSSAAGFSELAIASEVNTGTDGTRSVTPDALAGSTFGIRYVQLTIAGPGNTPTTGDGQAQVVIPPTLAGYNVVSVQGGVTTVSSSGTPTFQLRRLRSGSAVDVLSTGVTIDINEYTSSTAATPPVINTSNDDLADGDILLADLDVVGTGAKGHALLVGIQLP